MTFTIKVWYAFKAPTFSVTTSCTYSIFTKFENTKVELLNLNIKLFIQLSSYINAIISPIFLGCSQSLAHNVPILEFVSPGEKRRPQPVFNADSKLARAALAVRAQSLATIAMLAMPNVLLLTLCLNGGVLAFDNGLSFSPRRDYGLSNVTDLMSSSSLSYLSNYDREADFSTALVVSGSPYEKQFHHLQKREYNYTNYNWAGYIDFVLGPYTFVDQIAIVGSNMVFSVVNYLIVGN